MKKFNQFIKTSKHTIDFCTTRKVGATKIADKAEKAGGLSQLTAWHFLAKLPAYDDVINMSGKNNLQEILKNKCGKLLSEVEPKNMTQKRFQEIMGKIEVYGETICELNNIKE